MNDPISQRLGKDIADLIRRQLHRYRWSAVNREYVRRLACVYWDGKLRFDNGFLFQYRANDFKHANIYNWKKTSAWAMLPVNYW